MKNSKLILCFGIFFLGFGLFFNEANVRRIISPDGLPLPAKFVVWTVEFFLVALGVVLIVLRRRRDLVKNIFILLITLILCLVFMELFLRAGDRKVEKLKLMRVNSFGTGSFRLQPLLQVKVHLGDKEVLIKTNAYSMRWREVSYSNPFQKKRIAFVGDSFAFGLWADSIEHSIVGIFDSSLDDEKYEVLNFGVCGYGPPDIKLQIQEEILPFGVDDIILLFWNGNDFGDSYSGKDKYIVVDGTIKWRQNNNNLLLIELKEFITNLSLYKLLDRSIGLIRARSLFSLNKPLSPAIMWSQKEYSDFGKKVLNRTLSELEDIHRLCVTNNIRLMFVSIPFEEQVYVSDMKTKDYDFNYPQKFLEMFCDKHRIPYLDLLPFLRQHVHKRKAEIFLEKDAHFNNEGHRLTSQRIIQFYQEEEEMGKVEQMILNGELGCSMCGWFMDKVNGDYKECGMCGFKFRRSYETKPE